MMKIEQSEDFYRMDGNTFVGFDRFLKLLIDKNLIEIFLKFNKIINKKNYKTCHKIQ